MLMNPKKLYRLYRDEGLSVRRRRGRKHASLRNMSATTTPFTSASLR